MQVLDGLFSFHIWSIMLPVHCLGSLMTHPARSHGDTNTDGGYEFIS